MKANRILAAAVMTLGLLSCKGESPKEAPQKKMDFPVSISIEGNKGAMRAAQQGTSLTGSFANERAIENLTVVVFKLNTVTNQPDAVEKVIPFEQLTKPAGATAYAGTYQFDMKAEGEFQIEVIANGYKQGDANAQKVFLAMLQKKPLPYNEYQKLLVERALPKNGETGFVMLNADPIKVTTSQNKTADAGSIKLRRLACRFDVFNKLGDELVLTKATLQNQITKSYLLTQTDVPTGADSKAEYAKDGKWFTDNIISGGIYSYENPTKGATKLLLEGTYKGTTWKKTIEFKDAGQDIATQRNHIYRVFLTKGTGVNPGGDDSTANLVNYNIQVLDWEVDGEFAYTDGDVWAAGEETFTQYSLVSDPAEFEPKGGTGHVSCVKTVYAGKDATGRVLSKTNLQPDEFTLSLKTGDASLITIDDASKSFTIKETTDGASFVLEATVIKNGVVLTIPVKSLLPLVFLGIETYDYSTDGRQNSTGRDRGIIYLHEIYSRGSETVKYAAEHFDIDRTTLAVGTDEFSVQRDNEQRYSYNIKINASEINQYGYYIGQAFLYGSYVSSVTHERKVFNHLRVEIGFHK